MNIEDDLNFNATNTNDSQNTTKKGHRLLKTLNHASGAYGDGDPGNEKGSKMDVYENKPPSRTRKDDDAMEFFKNDTSEEEPATAQGQHFLNPGNSHYRGEYSPRKTSKGQKKSKSRDKEKAKGNTSAEIYGSPKNPRGDGQFGHKSTKTKTMPTEETGFVPPRPDNEWEKNLECVDQSIDINTRGLTLSGENSKDPFVRPKSSHKKFTDQVPDEFTPPKPKKITSDSSKPTFGKNLPFGAQEPYKKKPGPDLNKAFHDENENSQEEEWNTMEREVFGQGMPHFQNPVPNSQPQPQPKPKLKNRQIDLLKDQEKIGEPILFGSGFSGVENINRSQSNWKMDRSPKDSP